MQKNCKNILFKNRKEVALRLEEVLPIYEMKHEKWIIIAVSAGGFAVASYLAKRLDLEIDLLFNQAIYSPINKECEIARVSETEEIVIHELLVDSFAIQNDYIFGEAKRQYEDKILPQIYKYRKDSTFCALENRKVLLLDEGSETGLKLMVGVKSAFEMGVKAIFVAAPVLPDNISETLRKLVDDVFSIYEVQDYLSTKSYYDEFKKVTPEKLLKLFEERRIRDEERD